MADIGNAIFECPIDKFRTSERLFTEKIPNWKPSHTIDLSNQGGKNTIRSLVWFNKKLYVICGNEGGVYCFDQNEISNVIPFNLREQKFYDIATSPDGSIILSDQDEGLIYKIGADSRLQTFDNHGTVLPSSALNCDEKGDIYLGETDEFVVRITILDQNGCELNQIKLNTNQDISEIRKLSISSITIGPIGRDLYAVYVLDRNCDMIFRFESNGKYRWKIPHDDNPRWYPHYITRPWHASWIAVTCKKDREVFFFDGNENNERSRYKLSNFIPSALAFDSKGNMFVGDLKAPKVYVYKIVNRLSSGKTFVEATSK